MKPELVSEERLGDLLEMSGWCSANSQKAFMEGASAVLGELGVVSVVEIPAEQQDVVVPRETLERGAILVRVKAQP